MPVSEPVLYTQPKCERCGAAKTWLAGRGVSARVLDIRAGDDALFAFMDTGARTTPTLVVGTTVLEGFDPDRWAAALEDIE